MDQARGLKAYGPSPRLFRLSVTGRGIGAQYNRRYPVPGLVPGTHVFLAQIRGSFKTWMTGPSPVTGDFLMPI
jgi:hypothetical protein